MQNIENIIKEMDTGDFSYVDIIDFIPKEMEAKIVEEEQLLKALTCMIISALMPHPLNAKIAGPKSTAKSTMVMGVVKYFPEDMFDINESISPQTLRYGATSWFDKTTDEDVTSVYKQLVKEHDYAPTGEKTKAKKKLDEFEEKYHRVNNFEDKCLIILENPGTNVLKQLRTIVEHDAWYLNSKSVYEAKQIELATRGWPSFIYITADSPDTYADKEIREQIESRFDTLYPTTSMSKIKSILDMKAEKAFNPVSKDTFIKNNNAQMQVKETIDYIKSQVNFHQNQWLEAGCSRKDIDLVLNPYQKDINKMFALIDTAEARISERMINLMQTITLSRLYKRPKYVIDGLTQFISVKEDYETIRELIEYFKFSDRSGSKDDKFIKEVIIPVYKHNEPEDGQQKIDDDERLRATNKDFREQIKQTDFVRSELELRLERLVEDGIIEIKTGRGGGTYLNVSFEELDDITKNETLIPVEPKHNKDTIREFIKNHVNDGPGHLIVDGQKVDSMGDEEIEGFIRRYY